MLHDLYLVSCYFDPAQAVLCEEELRARYGETPVADALQEGLIERICTPCANGRFRFFCRLSLLGQQSVQAKLA